MKKMNDLWNILLNHRKDPVIRALQNSFNSVSSTTRGRDLFWITALLLIIRDIPCPQINTVEKLRKIIDNAKDINLSIITRPKIPEYYNDKHTQEGRKQGRGIKHWYRNIKLDQYIEVPEEHWEVIVKNNLDLLK